MASFSLSQLAVPAVLLLIAFLAYTSQYLLPRLDPGPLTAAESLRFNVLLICMLISYARSIMTDAGKIPSDWPTKVDRSDGKKLRWCRKCSAPKPPRAHHCKVCKRCIPRMDHHCPWTANCVSSQTLPHFLRFLVYATLSLWTLEFHLYRRLAALYHNRHIHLHPNSPTPSQLLHLLLLFLTNTLTLFALTVMAVRALYSLLTNTTTIESWEIDRHASLLRRSRRNGGYLDLPGGGHLTLNPQEFPYDIGFLRNAIQGLGTSIPLLWPLPLAPTPPLIPNGVHFPENGFEASHKSWPPPDPERMPRVAPAALFKPPPHLVGVAEPDGSPSERVAAFRRRQARDLHRGLPATSAHADGTPVRGLRRRRSRVPSSQSSPSSSSSEVEGDEDRGGEGMWRDEKKKGSAWRNDEGELLGDFGVDDEDVDVVMGAAIELEDLDEDDIPLGRLLEMRKGQQQRQGRPVGSDGKG